MQVTTSFEILCTAISAAFIAQLLKFLGYLIVHRTINFKILTTTGGMPSSHSAGTVALSVSVGLICGYDSVEFAIATGYTLIVLYDAAGLRRAAGKTAACLNKMMEEFYNHDLHAVGGKLKELLGHTPLEVFVGAVYGVLFAFYFHMLIVG